MEKVVALSNNVTGRDKLYRITQYGSKLIGWYLERQQKDENVINLLRDLEKTMSTSRKLFRFGRSFESLRAAQRALNLQSYILSLTLATSHTNKAFYLLIDHYIWLGKVGIISTDLKKWGNSASRFWLASLVFAFIRDMYALYVEMERSLQNAKSEDGTGKIKPQSIVSAAIDVVKRNPPAVVDLIKNGCDMVIPATSLGYTNFNNGVVGFCGLVSSVLAALQVVEPNIKLKPN